MTTIRPYPEPGKAILFINVYVLINVCSLLTRNGLHSSYSLSYLFLDAYSDHSLQCKKL